MLWNELGVPVHRMKIVGLEYHERIRTYFQTHLCASQKQCARDLGIDISTVRKHVALIRAEWRGNKNETLY
jgi:hypothetical protein